MLHTCEALGLPTRNFTSTCNTASYLKPQLSVSVFDRPRRRYITPPSWRSTKVKLTKAMSNFTIKTTSMCAAKRVCSTRILVTVLYDEESRGENARKGSTRVSVRPQVPLSRASAASNLRQEREDCDLTCIHHRTSLWLPCLRTSGWQLVMEISPACDISSRSKVRELC